MVAWLDAHCAPRPADAREVKRRLIATTTSRAEEMAEVAAQRAWQRRLFDAGFAGLEVPEEYGGRGLTAAHARVWSEAVVRYDVDLRAGLGNALVVPTLLAHGSEAQKQQHIPAVLRGETVWCQLFSEPGAGSDLAGLTTRADRDGDEWIVNGQKVWNSYAHLADWAILLARTDWDVPKHRGIGFFLLDMTSPGVEARPLRQATGVAHFNETFLTDVRIPAEQLVGSPTSGWAVAQTTLASERAGIGRGAAGGIECSDWVELARHFGVTNDAATRQRLADLYTREQLASWLTRRARAASAGPGPESSVVKLLASAGLAHSADVALAIEGPYALLGGADAHEDGLWQQFFVGQWNARIGGGTEQIQRNVIAERILGLPSDPRPDKTEPFRTVARNGVAR